LRSVNVIPANKLSLQELDQLMGIKLLTSVLLENFGSQPQFPQGEMPVLPPLRTPMRRWYNAEKITKSSRRTITKTWLNSTQRQ